MGGKIFGVSIATLILVIVALVVGKKYGAQIPLIKAF
jgi:hypothetical protein